MPDRIYSTGRIVPVAAKMAIDLTALKKKGFRPTSVRVFATTIERLASDGVLHFTTVVTKFGKSLFREISSLTEF